MSRLHRAMSPAALVLSVLALLVATSAGSAYAAAKIGTKQLKDNAVTSKKIKNRTITVSDLATKTVGSLRGAAGPQGPVGPQGPGSITFNRSVPVNGSQGLALPDATVTMNCYSNQLLVQIDSTTPNGLRATGTFGYDGTTAVLGLDAVGSSAVGINQGHTSMWADLQISDRSSGRTGSFVIQGAKQGATCQFIGQYIP